MPLLPFTLAHWRCLSKLKLQHPAGVLLAQHPVIPMSSSSANEDVCCTSGKPTNNSNSGAGQVLECCGLRHYLTGSGRHLGIVLVHDIFGLDIGQTRQFADDLAAEAGATVLMSDLYAGKPWSLANFPPPDKTAFGAWLASTADAEAAKKVVLTASVPLIRERLEPGAKLGVLGFCWGGKVALMLCGDSGVFACGASAHPAFLNDALVKAVKVPIALLPASDDPDMKKLVDLLKDRPFFSRCLHRRYEGVTHGFCAARGDRDNSEQLAKINDACRTLAKFFKENGAA